MSSLSIMAVMPELMFSLKFAGLDLVNLLDAIRCNHLKEKKHMDWHTKLLNPTRQSRRDYKSLAAPVYRGSTVIFDDQESVNDDWQQEKYSYSYGLYGKPASLELRARIKNLECAHNCFMVPGGQAAIALVYMAYCCAGSHALVHFFKTEAKTTFFCSSPLADYNGKHR